MVRFQIPDDPKDVPELLFKWIDTVSKELTAHHKNTVDICKEIKTLYEEVSNLYKIYLRAIKCSLIAVLTANAVLIMYLFY